MIKLKELFQEIQVAAEIRAVPIIRSVTAVLILVYLMTLLFSYAELFGATTEDELISLSEKEIDKIRKKLALEEAERNKKDKATDADSSKTAPSRQE